MKTGRAVGLDRLHDAFDLLGMYVGLGLQDLHRVLNYVKTGDQLHMAHNFLFAELPWDATEFRTSIDDFEALTADLLPTDLAGASGGRSRV